MTKDEAVETLLHGVIAMQEQIFTKGLRTEPTVKQWQTACQYQASLVYDVEVIGADSREDLKRELAALAAIAILALKRL